MHAMHINYSCHQAVELAGHGVPVYTRQHITNSHIHSTYYTAHKLFPHYIYIMHSPHIVNHKHHTPCTYYRCLKQTTHMHITPIPHIIPTHTTYHNRTHRLYASKPHHCTYMLCNHIPHSIPYITCYICPTHYTTHMTHSTHTNQYPPHLSPLYP